MATESINLFSHRVDPCGVLALLRSLAPALEVVGPDDAWQEATITIARPGQQGYARLTFRRDADFSDRPGLSRQALSLPGYFSRFPESRHKRDILRLSGHFCCALATGWEPDLDPDGDERLPYLFAVTRHLDGLLFTQSSVRDAEGRILISTDGEFDDDAVLPQTLPLLPVTSEQGHPIPDREKPEEPGLPRPSELPAGRWP